MSGSTETLRVALLAGTLVQDGCEKQLFYRARALRDVGVWVRVYHLRKGEFYESVLRNNGIDLCYVGQFKNPLIRLALLAARFRGFRPHIIHSGNIYTNLYAGLVARFCHALSIGSMNSRLAHDIDVFGDWVRWGVRASHAIITNAEAVKRDAEAMGIDSHNVAIIKNAIHLGEFDAAGATCGTPLNAAGGPVMMAVGRLIPVKRFDRFIDCVARIRTRFPALMGVIVGDGPERAELERRAAAARLLPNGVSFLGHREDVPSLLRQADLLMLTSESEGMPNVILEAMAAGLPVITTPAGDSAVLVQHAVTGFVSPFEDEQQRADYVLRLLESAPLRRQLGEAGRRLVEEYHRFESLGERLLAVYRGIAKALKRRRLLKILGRHGTPSVDNELAQRRNVGGDSRLPGRS